MILRGHLGNVQSAILHAISQNQLKFGSIQVRGQISLRGLSNSSAFG